MKIVTDLGLLKIKSSPVDNINTPIMQNLFGDMVQTMYENEGIGLAAPQIGVQKRMIVVSGMNIHSNWLVANPEIVAKSDEMVENVESCLSIPNYSGLVFRHKLVVVRYLSYNGTQFTENFVENLAIVFQHEIDHLDGILFTDRTKKVWKNA